MASVAARKLPQQYYGLPLGIADTTGIFDANQLPMNGSGLLMSAHPPGPRIKGPRRSMARCPNNSGLTLGSMAFKASSTCCQKLVRSLGCGIGSPTLVSGLKPPKNVFLAAYVRCESSSLTVQSDLGGGGGDGCCSCCCCCKNTAGSGKRTCPNLDRVSFRAFVCASLSGLPS